MTIRVEKAIYPFCFVVGHNFFERQTQGETIYMLPYHYCPALSLMSREKNFSWSNDNAMTLLLTTTIIFCSYWRNMLEYYNNAMFVNK